MFVVRVNVAYISALDCHAFALKRLFASAHVTNGGGGGIMSTARTGFPYACITVASPYKSDPRFAPNI